MWKRRLLATIACAALAGVVRPARAETVWIEAEAALVPGEGTLTPPLVIRDRDDASGGSFIEAADGNNSTGAPPSAGIATYRVFIRDPGAYRIWGRVIAPDTASDSFWVRVNGGSWLRWNGMRLGSTWHWVPVTAGGARPAQVALVGGGYNVVQIAHREDGTGLDALVLSDEPAFDPAAVPSGPLPPPTVVRLTRGRGAVRVSWAVVAGAQSYTVKRQKPGETSFTTIASGVTGFVVTDAGLPRSGQQTCYQLVSVDGAGVAGHPRVACQSTEGFIEDWSPLHLGITAPMLLDAAGNLAVRPGLSSVDQPPASGRGVVHFQTPVSTQVKVWASVIAPGRKSDSLWVRMDGAYWIRWNGLGPRGCRGFAVVHDSNRRDEPVIFPLAPGSHLLELAYREPGVSVTRVVIQDDLDHAPACD